MIYIGIDPGVSGGIAVISVAETPASAIAFKMPSTERDILDLLHDIQNMSMADKVFACLETATASPQMGTVSSFSFGRGFGGLRMALTAERIPFDEVRPAKWQLVMGCRSKGDKNVTKRRAQQLFPDLKITHATADSLLIAEFCRRLNTPVEARA